MSSEEELNHLERQVEQTQASLQEKIERLEDHVTGTVEETVGAVRETVETVTDKVEEVTETVTEKVTGALDFAGHFERYPWPILGAAAVAGFVTGRLLFTGDENGSSEQMAKSFHRTAEPMREKAVSSPPTVSSVAESWGLPSQMTEFLDESATMLKGAALAAGSALVTEMVQSLFGDKVSHSVENRLTPYFKEENRI